jgi:histone H3/H4
MAEDANVAGSDEPLTELREQDRFLPMANVTRIMKRSLPDVSAFQKPVGSFFPV